MEEPHQKSNSGLGLACHGGFPCFTHGQTLLKMMEYTARNTGPWRTGGERTATSPVLLPKGLRVVGADRDGANLGDTTTSLPPPGVQDGVRGTPSIQG
jgi:hypothetical protein